jgi:hypothetical protein
MAKKTVPFVSNFSLTSDMVRTGLRAQGSGLGGAVRLEERSERQLENGWEGVEKKTKIYGTKPIDD